MSEPTRPLPEDFQERLIGLLREVGIEVFSPEVQDLILRIRDNEVCENCRYIPPPYTGIGTPIRVPGVTHHGDCPTVPQLSPEARARLNKKLDEHARARIDNRRRL